MEKQHCDQCENQCPIDALQCGHFLHHGGADEADLSALNPAEQAELERLLTVLLTDWKKRMPSERPDHRHGHHSR